jgi:hypothetical protein
MFIKGISVSNSAYLKCPEKIIRKGKKWGTHLIAEVVLSTVFAISNLRNGKIETSLKEQKSFIFGSLHQTK